MLSASFATGNPPDTDSSGNPAFNVPAGKDLYVPIVGDTSDSTPVSYSVSSSNSSVSASVITTSSTNPELVINVSGTTSTGTAFTGVMKFQLFGDPAPNTVQNMVNLVNSGFYSSNPAAFYRIIEGAANTNNSGAIIQGGTDNAASQNKISDEFNSALTVNSPGLLIMANTGAANSGSSEFFVVSPTTTLGNEPQTYDDNYAVFGILTSETATSGPSDLFNDIMNATVNTGRPSPSGGSYITGVSFTASIATSDPLNAVVQISEPSTYTGEATITVNSTGGDSSTSEGNFNVNVISPAENVATGNVALAINPIDSSTISTTGIAATSFTVTTTEASGISGAQVTYTVTDPGTFGDTLTTASDVTVSIAPDSSDPTKAVVTLTPKANVSTPTTINLVMHATVSNGSTTYQDTLPFSLTVNPASPTATFTSAPNVNSVNSNTASSGVTQTTTQVVVTYAESGGTIDTSTFGTGNITVTGPDGVSAPVQSFTASGNTVTYTVGAPGGSWQAQADQGTYTITLNADSVKDTGGMAVPTATQTFIVDTNAPTSTITLASGQSATTTTSPIVYDVSFSEPVVGFNSAAAVLLTGSAPGSLQATVAASDDTGENYTVTVSGMNGSGTVTMQVASGAATDAAGNPNVTSNTETVQFNLQNFSVTGNTLTVTGTSGNDTFLLDLGSDGSFTASLNGNAENYTTSQITAVNFVGNGGSDETVVFGSLGTVNITLGVNTGTVTGSNYAINFDSSTNYVYGSSGSSVTFNNSTGPNTFVGTTGYSYESGPNNYFNMAVGFSTAGATSASGNSDTAFLYSASGATVNESPTTSSVTLGSTTVGASGFTTVYAFAAGNDTAVLNGSNDVDAYVGTTAYAYMDGYQSGVAFFEAALGFASTRGNGGSGINTAYLYGATSGNNTLAASSGAAGMAGGNVQNIVSGFGTINTQGQSSNSTAQVDEISGHGTTLLNNGGSPQLTSSSGTVNLNGFVQVKPVHGFSSGAAPAAGVDFVMQALGSSS